MHTRRLALGPRMMGHQRAQRCIDHFQFGRVEAREYIYIAIGSVMVMFVAQTLFFFGVQLSNMTTMTLTLLALPFITLLLELLLGRIKVSSLDIYDLIGFTLISVGYDVVYVSKPQP